MTNVIRLLQAESDRLDAYNAGAKARAEHPDPRVTGPAMACPYLHLHPLQSAWIAGWTGASINRPNFTDEDRAFLARLKAGEDPNVVLAAVRTLVVAAVKRVDLGGDTTARALLTNAIERIDGDVK